MFTVLFLLGCSDLISVRIGESTIRMYYLACAATVPFLWSRARVPGRLLIGSVALFALLLPSVVMSVDLVRSVAYLVWVVVSVIVSYVLLPTLLELAYRRSQTMARPNDLYDMLIVLYRLQLLLGLALYFAGVDERPRSLYYEPSYFSISLAIYVNLVINRWVTERVGALDAVLIATYLLTSFSGAFLLVVGLSLLLNVTVKQIRIVALGVMLTLLAAVVYVFTVDDLNTALIRGLFDGSLDANDLLLRGGNRYSRILVARDIFLQHPLTGVGLGAFETVTAGGTFDLYNDDTPWLSADGFPAINVYLEILATAGVVGAMGFIWFFWRQVRWLLSAGFGSPISKGVICMLLLLTFESNYLRPYLWIALSIAWYEQHGANRYASRRFREGF